MRGWIGTGVLFMMLVGLGCGGGKSPTKPAPPGGISPDAPTLVGVFADANRFPVGYSIAQDAAGRSFIHAGDRVKVFSATGELAEYWGGLQGVGEGLTVDNAGYVFVAEGVGGITKRAPDGSVVARYNPSFADRIERLALGPNGLIYAPDPIAGEVEVFAGADLAYRGSFQTLSDTPLNGREIMSLHVAPDTTLLIIAGPPNFVHRVRQDGTPWYSFGLKGDGPGQLQAPVDLAVLPGGDILVLDQQTALVSHFTALGHFVERWPTTTPGDGCGGETAILVTAQGTLLVLGGTPGCTKEFTVGGTLLRRWPATIDEPVGIVHPVCLAAVNHDVLVGGSSVLGYDVPGANGREIPIGGVTSLAVDASGDIFATRTEGPGVWKYTSQGAFITRWGNQVGTADGQFEVGNAGLSLGPDGLLYVCDSGNDRVQVFKVDGTFVRKFGTTGAAPGQFSNPSAIAVSAGGDLYVVDAGNSRVERFRSDGSVVRAWGSVGSEEGLFQNPEGIAVGPDGAVYVADSGNYRIEKFTPEGGFLVSWGGVVGATTELAVRPSAVATDAQGKIYVADYWNSRVQVFAYP